MKKKYFLVALLSFAVIIMINTVNTHKVSAISFNDYIGCSVDQSNKSYYKNNFYDIIKSRGIPKTITKHGKTLHIDKNFAVNHCFPLYGDAGDVSSSGKTRQQKDNYGNYKYLGLDMDGHPVENIEYVELKNSRTYVRDGTFIKHPWNNSSLKNSITSYNSKPYTKKKGKAKPNEGSMASNLDTAIDWTYLKNGGSKNNRRGYFPKKNRPLGIKLVGSNLKEYASVDYYPDKYSFGSFNLYQTCKFGYCYAQYIMPPLKLLFDKDSEKADLAVTHFSPSSHSGWSGDSVKLNFTLKNKGNVNIKNPKVKITFNGNTQLVKFDGNLKPEKTVQGNESITLPGGGSYKAKIVANPSKENPKNDLQYNQNNKASTSIQSKEANRDLEVASVKMNGEEYFEGADKFFERDVIDFKYKLYFSSDKSTDYITSPVVEYGKNGGYSRQEQLSISIDSGETTRYFKPNFNVSRKTTSINEKQSHSVVDKITNFFEPETAHAYSGVSNGDKVINMPDENLRRLVNYNIGKGYNKSLITKREIKNLNKIEAIDYSRTHLPKRTIHDLTGLEKATHLKKLNLDNNMIDDLRPISNLTQLTHLSLENQTKSNLHFGKFGQSRQTKTITIPDSVEINDVTVDNGNVDYHVIGNKLTITVSGGNSEQKENAEKNAKTVTKKRTSSSDSFDDSIEYAKNGYKGTLTKSNHYVDSGKFIPAKYKTVHKYKTSRSSHFDNSTYYSSGGYHGYIQKDGRRTRRKLGGHYYPSKSKHVSGETSRHYNKRGYSGTLTKYLYSGSKPTHKSKTVSKTKTKTYYDKDEDLGDCPLANCFSGSIHYNHNGYSGTLTPSSSGFSSVSETQFNCYIKQEGFYEGTKFCDKRYTRTYSGTVTKTTPDTRVYRYKGNVTKPSRDTRYYEYKQRYEGRVKKPSVDTRVWAQEYKGKVYKKGSGNGNDNYYEYNVKIDFDGELDGLNIRPLGNLNNLEFLNIGQNDIKNINPLSSMHKLRQLKAHKNDISDISPLRSLSSLNKIVLDNNHITDASNVINRVNSFSAVDQEVTIDKDGLLNEGYAIKIAPEKNINLTFDDGRGAYENGKIVWKRLNGYADDYTVSFKNNQGNFSGEITQFIKEIREETPIYVCDSQGSYIETVYDENNISHGSSDNCTTDLGKLGIPDNINDLEREDFLDKPEDGDFTYVVDPPTSNAPTAKPVDGSDFKEDTENAFVSVVRGTLHTEVAYYTTTKTTDDEGNEHYHLHRHTKWVTKNKSSGNTETAPYQSVNRVYDVAVGKIDDLDPKIPVSREQTDVTFKAHNYGNQDIRDIKSTITYDSDKFGIKGYNKWLSEGIKRGPYNGLQAPRGANKTFTVDSLMMDIEKRSRTFNSEVKLQQTLPEVSGKEQNERITENNTKEFETTVENPNARVYLHNSGDKKNVISNTGGIKVVIENKMFRDISSPSNGDERETRDDPPTEASITIIDENKDKPVPKYDSDGNVDEFYNKYKVHYSGLEHNDKKVIDLSDDIEKYMKDNYQIDNPSKYEIGNLKIQVQIPEYEQEVGFSGNEKYRDNHITETYNYFPERPNVSLMECNVLDAPNGYFQLTSGSGQPNGPIKMCAGHYPNNPSTAIEEGMQSYHFAMHRFLPAPMPKYEIKSPFKDNETSPEYFNQVFKLDEGLNEKGDNDSFIFKEKNGKIEERGRYIPTEATFDFKVKDKQNSENVIARGEITYELPDDAVQEETLDIKHQYGIGEVMFFVPNNESNMLDKPKKYTDDKVKGEYPINDSRIPYLNPGLYEFELNANEKYDYYYQTNKAEHKDYYWSEVKKR